MKCIKDGWSVRSVPVSSVVCHSLAFFGTSIFFFFFFLKVLYLDKDLCSLHQIELLSEISDKRQEDRPALHIAL